MDRERLFTVTETCDYLGITRQRVYDLIKTGELRAFRLGSGTFRIPESALDAFLTPVEPSAEEA